MTTATQSEFAAIIGKDKSYVTRLKQSGRLVLTADGAVDIEKSQNLIAMTADPTRAAAVEARQSESAAPRQLSTPSVDAIGSSFQQAKAINEKYKALTAKLEYERASGKLIEADAARLFAADLAASFRASLEILPDRLAPELVPMSETETIRALLVETFEQVLTDLADKITKWGNS